MKKLLSISLVSMVLILPSGGALFTLNVSATSSSLVNSPEAGGGLYSGQVLVGLHSNPGAISPGASLTQILTGFVQFAALSTDLPGFMTNKEVILDDGGNAAPPNNAGQIYVIVGDGDENRAVFTDTSWQLGTFVAPPTPTPSLEILIGDFTPTMDFPAGGFFGSGGATGSTIQLVPEPGVLPLAVASMAALLYGRSRLRK